MTDSEELFSDTTAWVGLFLWKADGSFDEVRVSAGRRPSGFPPGQAAPADPGGLVQARLAEVGKYVLEPITVKLFTKQVHGTEFGWKVGRYEGGAYFINIEPGDFICYYAPWDGYGHDT